jgi:hypothetical protein
MTKNFSVECDVEGEMTKGESVLQAIRNIDDVSLTVLNRMRGGELTIVISDYTYGFICGTVAVLIMHFVMRLFYK